MKCVLQVSRRLGALLAILATFTGIAPGVVASHVAHGALAGRPAVKVGHLSKVKIKLSKREYELLEEIAAADGVTPECALAEILEREMS